MPIDQFSYRLDPYRANYNALYPTGESRGECFAKDFVRAVPPRNSVLSYLFDW
jgi:hypothetical protein